MFNTSELDELFWILNSIKGFKLRQQQWSNTTLSATYYFFLYLQQEERLEARCLSLQKAVKQQTHQETEEEEGRAYFYI